MADWDEHQAIVSEVYAVASAALGYDLWSVTAQGPSAKLNQTEVTQPAMLCAGVASCVLPVNSLQFRRQP